MNVREVHKSKTSPDVETHFIFRGLVHPVPFIDTDHQGSACFDHIAEQMQILLDNTLFGIDDQDHHMSIFDRLKRLHNGKFFNGFLGFTPLADTGSIDQRVGFAAPFEGNINTVPCRTGLVIDHHPLLSKHSVDES